MSEVHYALGLDIGIASVGWAVLRNGLEGEPERVETLGVRIFDVAEHPKTGASLAAPRREARSARRRLRRRRHRLERIRYLMEQRGVMNVSDIQTLYAAGSFEKSPYQLRAEALDRPLTREETVRVLIHLAQRRGYKSNSTSEAAKDEKADKTAVDQANASIQTMANATVTDAQIENLITAKGYTDCVVFMADDGVSVVVSAGEDGLQTEDIARITDIVKQETELTADCIKILEVN